MSANKLIGAALVAVLGLGLAGPAGAASSGPQIMDKAGDANGINGQGSARHPLLDGTDTRPASIEGADIRSLSFETVYETEQVRDEDGALTRVAHVSTGLKIVVETSAPIGSSVFRVPVEIDGCSASFGGWALSLEPDRAAIELEQPDCPGSQTAISSGLKTKVMGNLLGITIPFGAPAFAGELTEFIREGTKLRSPAVTVSLRDDHVSRFPTVRGIASYSWRGEPGPLIEGPVTDQTHLFQGFTVGSDVPADVNCEMSPEKPECST